MKDILSLSGFGSSNLLPRTFFNLKMNPIPNPIVVNTGGQGTVTNTIDDFFVETINYVKEQYEVEGLYFEIKSRRLEQQSLQVTNDRITYLCYQDIILASVFETRTEFNYVRYTFFRNLESLNELTSRE